MTMRRFLATLVALLWSVTAGHAQITQWPAANANITGGAISGVTINNSSIGLTTPAAGQFSTLTITGFAFAGTQNSLNFNLSNGTAFTYFTPTGAANYIASSAAASGSAPSFGTAGSSDANIDLAFYPKGTGTILIGGVQNSLRLSGSATGVPVALKAVGGDTNVGLALVPAGTGALTAAVPDNTAAGGNARGANAVDLQTSRSAAAQVASGGSSFAAGQGNTASNNQSSALGFQNNVSGPNGFAAGNQNLVSGNSSVSLGQFATDRGRYSAQIFSAGFLSASGDAQIGTFVLRASSTSTTPVRLTSDGGAAGAANCVNIPNNTAFKLETSIIGLNVTTTGNASGFFHPGFVLTRGASAATTTLTAFGTQYGPGGPGTGPASFNVSADTTNGCLNISVTPPNTDTWHWVARVTTVEVQ